MLTKSERIFLVVVLLALAVFAFVVDSLLAADFPK